MMVPGREQGADGASVPADETGRDAPVDVQQGFWNEWNGIFLGHQRGLISQRQAEVVRAWLERLGRRDLDILDVGCGTGWMCAHLAAFGRVTGTDLSDVVLQTAQRNLPEVRFVAGDFMTLALPDASSDVVVTLEVLAHVADQSAFLARIARLLKPGGRLMLATQNRFVMERWEGVAPRAHGQIRQWVSVRELRRLLDAEFVVAELFTVFPYGNRGILRVINSPRLNGILARYVGQQRLDRWKERVGLGHTTMALAVRRPVLN